MARRTVFICDGQDCGAVLVNPTDGFVVLNAITTTDTDAPTVLVSALTADGAAEAVLCRECMAKTLGFSPT